MRNNDSVRSYVNLFAFLLVILMNYLANALPLNGQTTGEVSAQYPVLYTPAGYVFSIWGFIYLLTGIWVIYQLIPKHREHPVFKKASYWFALSCVLNIGWILLWHYEFINLTLVVMVSLLLTLIIIYRKTADAEQSSFWLRAPFSVYLGWISVATIVNTGVVLVENNWSQWGISAEAWTVIMLAIGCLLAVWFAFSNKDFLYPLVFIWAFIGITVKQSEYDMIVNTAWVLVGILSIVVLIRAFRRFQSV
ncbi:TspO/MBR family protein [Pseudalkalibacillus caeni]|uniref:Tryptophan-rich sensory protein n=1 Tax=Exobacillus caeni TaxID=2574798 RepID=A0A5R9F1X2_9BACL|nr:TspO/MBR family protein [Pseudalkalibacillus caeni]TLS37041.1 tryptophan-rich sensory protein [Pseudalkalibacillus caeni]